MATLEDVTLHLRLPINGLCCPMLQDMCQTWLGKRLGVSDFDGCAIKMMWLKTNFQDLG